MSINSNEVKLIGILLQAPNALSKLAEEMEVSRRHISNYIANINYYIDQAISVKKGIATLEITREQWADRIKLVPLSHYRPMSSERQDYLLDNYLFLEQGKFLDIEKQLGISRPTLKKDLSELALRLQLCDLSIQYSDGGFTIGGTEKKIRHLMMERANKQVIHIHPAIEYCTPTTPLQFHTQLAISQLLSRLPIKETQVIIGNISNAIGGDFPAHFTQMMFLYLSVSLSRISKKFIILQKDNADYIRRTTKFSLVYDQLSLLINERLEYEHLHLTEYFFSGCALDNFHENQLRVEMCSMLFLRQLGQSMSLSQGQMALLHTQLCQYLPSAIYRIKNHVRLQSTLNKELESLDDYQMTIQAMSTCQSWLPEPLRDEELHQIYLFIEQVKQSEQKEQISLRDLLGTIQKYAKEIDYEPLKRELVNQYPTSFLDDTQPDYLCENWFSRTDIHWIKPHTSLIHIADLGALHLAERLGVQYSEIQQPLAKVLTSFFDYLHMGSNVYFYSAQATSQVKRSSLQLVIQAGDMLTQTPPAYYFFLIRNDSSTAHNILYALKQFEQDKWLYERDNEQDVFSESSLTNMVRCFAKHLVASEVTGYRK